MMNKSFWKYLCAILVMGCVMIGCADSVGNVNSIQEPAAESSVEDSAEVFGEEEKAEIKEEIKEDVKEEELPAQQNRTLDEVVSEAIFEENRGAYYEHECAAEGHIILDTEETEQGLKVYALTMYGEYQFQDGNFVKASGSGVIAAVLEFEKQADGNLKLSEFSWPEDGNRFVKSIEEMFPKKYWEECISPKEETRKELKRQERVWAQQYLDKLGRTAVIGEYADFEHILLTEAGVSVEVSNKLFTDTDLNRYPDWIGNVEFVENGIRYVYTKELDAEAGIIIFRKTEYDTGNVAEERIFSMDTGEEDEERRILLMSGDEPQD